MKEMESLNFDDFAAKYCNRQEQTPEVLRDILKRQDDLYRPAGWMMLECHMFDSSQFGNLTIIPYGPNNTFREPPDYPVSPRGLASDMSVVIALLENINGGLG